MLARQAEYSNAFKEHVTEYPALRTFAAVGEAPGMSTEDFAPFESRSDNYGVAGDLNFLSIISDSFTLTLRTLPQWAALALLNGTLLGFCAYLSGRLDSGFYMLVMLLFQVPTTLAAYYRILLARKRGEPLSLWQAIGFGLSRSVRMLATGFVLLILFWFVCVVTTFLAMLCSALHPVVGLGAGIVMFGVGIYLALRWQLALSVCVVENLSFGSVISRSHQLTENRVAPLFLIGLIVWALQMGLNFGITATVGGLFAAADQNLGMLLAVPLVSLLYAGTFMVPLTSQFLCYYALADGYRPEEEREGPEEVGFTRA